MAIHTKTLRVRIKDKHAKVLSRWAFEVNQVWNAANALSAEYSWVPIPGTQSVGIDLGLKTAATCSDGFKLERRRGTLHDRDVNAAKNTLRLGHQALEVGIPAL